MAHHLIVLLGLKALRSKKCLHPHLGEAVLKLRNLIRWIDVHLSNLKQHGKSDSNIM